MLTGVLGIAAITAMPAIVLWVEAERLRVETLLEDAGLRFTPPR